MACYRNKRRKIDKFQKQKDDIISKKKRIKSIKKMISINNLSRALAETEVYLDDYPNDSSGLFQHANILWLSGMVEDAKKEFNYIIDHELSHKYSSIYKLGIIAINQENIDKAYEYFKYNIDNSPYEEISSIKEISNIELERGNYEEAYNVLEKYSDMNNDQILLQAAYVLYAQEKYEEAYNIIMNYDFLKNPYITSDYYRIRGIIEIGLEKYDDAQESLEKSLGDDRNDAYYKIKIELARLYFSQRNFMKAIDTCIEVLDVRQKKYMEKALIILGNVYQLMFQYEKANECYLESVNYSDSKDKKGWFYAGNISMIKKHYKQAKEYYNKYIEKSSVNSNFRSKAYLKLALIASKEENLEELEENLRKINKNDLVEIDKDDYRCLKLHVCYKKGISISGDSYRKNQLYNYDLDELVKHIDRVHISYDEKETSFFDDGIDIEELVCQIPELLSKAYIVDNHYYERYQVIYPNIGYVNGEKTDTLELLVFPESQKVLTMFPVKNNEYYYEKKKYKCKRKTQIEKFNQRYGNKSEY